MKIALNEIPEEGVLSVECVQSRESLNKLFDKESLPCRFIDPVKGRFKLSRNGGAVTVAIALTGSIDLTCSICLGAFNYPLENTSRVTLFPYEDAEKEDKAPLKESLDKDYYYNNIIDVSLLLREEATLLIPFNPRCKPDCKGICATCGVDLNKRDCDCPAAEIDPRLAVLKNFKIQ